MLARALTGPGGVATAVGANHAALAVDPQTFGVFVAVAPGVDAGVAEAALDAVVADFLAAGPAEEEVRGRRRGWPGRWRRRRSDWRWRGSGGWRWRPG